MSHAAAPIVWSAEAPPTLRFERRAAERERLEGPAAAIQLGGDHFGRFHRLDLCDWSAGGIGATSDTAIEPGTALSIGFASAGGRACRGMVRRCVPCGRGYSLGIEFQRDRAA